MNRKKLSNNEMVETFGLLMVLFVVFYCVLFVGSKLFFQNFRL